MSQHRAPKAVQPANNGAARATGKTRPYMAGQALPADTLAELGSPDDLDLTLKNMILIDLILKECSFQLKGKRMFFRRSSRAPKRRERKTSISENHIKLRQERQNSRFKLLPEVQERCQKSNKNRCSQNGLAYSEKL